MNVITDTDLYFLIQNHIGAENGDADLDIPQVPPAAHVQARASLVSLHRAVRRRPQLGILGRQGHEKSVHLRIHRLGRSVSSLQ